MFLSDFCCQYVLPAIDILCTINRAFTADYLKQNYALPAVRLLARHLILSLYPLCKVTELLSTHPDQPRPNKPHLLPSAFSSMLQQFSPDSLRTYTYPASSHSQRQLQAPQNRYCLLRQSSQAGESRSSHSKSTHPPCVLSSEMPPNLSGGNTTG